MGRLAYIRPLGDAEDSPVTDVGSPNEGVGGILLIYTF
jgi:hypothetical protein